MVKESERFWYLFLLPHTGTQHTNTTLFGGGKKNNRRLLSSASRLEMTSSMSLWTVKKTGEFGTRRRLRSNFPNLTFLPYFYSTFSHSPFFRLKNKMPSSGQNSYYKEITAKIRLFKEIFSQFVLIRSGNWKSAIFKYSPMLEIGKE